MSILGVCESVCFLKELIFGKQTNKNSLWHFSLWVGFLSLEARLNSIPLNWNKIMKSFTNNWQIDDANVHRFTHVDPSRWSIGLSVCGFISPSVSLSFLRIWNHSPKTGIFTTQLRYHFVSSRSLGPSVCQFSDLTMKKMSILFLVAGRQLYLKRLCSSVGQSFRPFVGPSSN